MIPVVLFAYSRPAHLSRALNALKANQVPLIYAFSDGPRKPDNAGAVAEVRRLLHAVDWCRVVVCERNTNLGLGRSILAGVTEILKKHSAAIIIEDDIVCVPGSYNYLCAALEHYKDDSRVMSVSAWNHSLITPADIKEQPYFDGRPGCWGWGTWDRAWEGMQTDAKTLMQNCLEQGIDVYKYGTDLVEMAKVELKWNIWAVRFAYLHILKKGLSLRPPWGMAEQIGFGTEGSNTLSSGRWVPQAAKPCPPLTGRWPEPLEHPDCALLHQNTSGKRPGLAMRQYYFLRRITPRPIWRMLQRLKA
ncbi:MAG: hypothetical protein A2X34_09395 [Elusimicrobia bacterium GWC2_51_8]|nr:MAG: hypothetical protein A2X33_04235 [Elusimicrobia bacterium GWA2_51_34]OGR58097.1 MAG: hypothetical protein A2X34_09395 [Elusimicrobia bacterium GWC2_51_8]HAF96482.1 hypothetical protein [Elusimicrobiota bacterium]HCE97561.1 hypothetical protein [Elusimicrobiota bacterium]